MVERRTHNRETLGSNPDHGGLPLECGTSHLS